MATFPSSLGSLFIAFFCLLFATEVPVDDALMQQGRALRDDMRLQYGGLDALRSLRNVQVTEESNITIGPITITSKSTTTFSVQNARSHSIITNKGKSKTIGFDGELVWPLIDTPAGKRRLSAKKTIEGWLMNPLVLLTLDRFEFVYQEQVKKDAHTFDVVRVLHPTEGRVLVVLWVDSKTKLIHQRIQPANGTQEEERVTYLNYRRIEGVPIAYKQLSTQGMTNESRIIHRVVINPDLPDGFYSSNETR